MRKYFWILIWGLCIVTFAACNKVEEENKDTCVAVSLSEGQDVKWLFKFESVTETNLTLTGAVNVSKGKYFIGKLENGNSIVWKASNKRRFVYVQGEATDQNIIHYDNVLDQNSISYKEFKEIYKNDF